MLKLSTRSGWISILSLAVLAGLGLSLEAMTLEECDRRGLKTCLTGFPEPNLRALLNAAIEAEPEIKRALSGELRATDEEVDEILSASEPLHRRKRSVRRIYDERTDCQSVCCAKVNQSEPMQFLRRKDGWGKVLSTPEYPQRTVFRMESCVNPGGRCRDVKSTKKRFSPRCRTTFRRQKIILYEMIGGRPSLREREISIPTSCRCVLWSVERGTERSHHDRRRRSSAQAMLDVLHEITEVREEDEGESDVSAAGPPPVPTLLEHSFVADEER